MVQHRDDAGQVPPDQLGPLPVARPYRPDQAGCLPELPPERPVDNHHLPRVDRHVPPWMDRILSDSECAVRVPVSATWFSRVDHRTALTCGWLVRGVPNSGTTLSWVALMVVW